MAVTTTEMLSNQLSNWLSQISNDFDIGFVYRPGYKDVNSQEVQVAPVSYTHLTLPTKRIV